MTTREEEPRPAPFDLSGGAPCLDFANTLADRPRCTKENLAEYGDLLRWGAEAGLLTPDEEERLRRRAARRPGEARETFRRAIELRETVYRIFSGLAAGRPPVGADLTSLNAALARALPNLRVRGAESGGRWAWAGRPASLDRPLWPVARSAADLLTSPDTRLVRECGSDRCSWLFLDRSRSGRRRWCDMQTCGNRAKARRHYERKKKRKRSS
jgi:predicted RNA-binding Zn ribbon-like protein